MMCHQPDCGLAIFQRVEYHILHHVIASRHMGAETNANLLQTDAPRPDDVHRLFEAIYALCQLGVYCLSTP